MATVSPIVSQAEILAAVAAGRMTVEQAAALLPNQSRPVGQLRCKVGAKGGVSLYGVNSRFPVTMYAEQWERVLAYADEIRAFIKSQNGTLKHKAAVA